MCVIVQRSNGVYIAPVRGNSMGSLCRRFLLRTSVYKKQYQKMASELCYTENDAGIKDAISKIWVCKLEKSGKEARTV